MTRTALILAGVLAMSGTAWSQCSHCGSFHGGAPSTEQMKQSAESLKKSGDEIMDRFREQDRKQREDYAKKSDEVMSQERERQAKLLGTTPDKIPNADQQKMLRALNDAKTSELLFSSGASAQDLVEASKQLTTAESKDAKAERDRTMTTLIGTEASRLRRKVEIELKEIRTKVAETAESVKKAVTLEGLRKQYNELMGKETYEKPTDD